MRSCFAVPLFLVSGIALAPLRAHSLGESEVAVLAAKDEMATTSVPASPGSGEDRLQNFVLQASPRRSDEVISMTSDAVVTTGTAAEIIHRAQLCSAKHVQQKKGDSLVQVSQPEAGLLVVNLQSEFRSGLSARLVRAKLAVEARDGRFRFTASDLDTPIEGRYYYPGVYKVWGTGWEAALNSIKAVTDAVANCMTKAASDDW